MKPFNITREYECEISCALTPERKGGRQHKFDQPDPAEPAEVEDLYVGVIIRGTSIDITSLLNDKQRTHFEDLCLEEAEFAQEEGSL